MRNFMLKVYGKARMLREDHGQDLIEYAIVGGLITVACVAVISGLSGTLVTLWTNIAGAVTSAT